MRLVLLPQGGTELRPFAQPLPMLTPSSSWGPPYLHSAFLYHFTRLDVRHNFAPHFLPAYLGRVDGAISAAPGTAGALVGFVPQAAVVLLLGALLGKHDLVFACAAQTLAFVTFNKVSTSQVRLS